jgi:hypothetical protein
MRRIPDGWKAVRVHSSDFGDAYRDMSVRYYGATSGECHWLTVINESATVWAGGRLSQYNPKGVLEIIASRCAMWPSRTGFDCGRD